MSQIERGPAAAGGAAGDLLARTRELVHSRLFAALRELVRRAFTEAEQIARWWGPRGFTTTTHEMSVRPGKELVMLGRGKPQFRDIPERIGRRLTKTKALRSGVIILYYEIDGREAGNG